jgi:hypothetical protein
MLVETGALVDKARAGFEAQRALIASETRLSPEGKAEQLGKADATYRAQVSTLIDAAAGHIDAAEARIAAQLERERAAAAAAEFDALGAPFIERLIERDLRTLPETEILAAVKSSPAHDWTQRATLRLAIAELRERQRAGKIEAELSLTELERMAEPPSTAQLRKQRAALEAQRREIASWSPDYEQALVSRFGIK